MRLMEIGREEREKQRQKAKVEERLEKLRLFEIEHKANEDERLTKMRLLEVELR